MSRFICNPILPGFNPDPSIVRVNEDYYIATSTFEWFPGVQIYHSRDLVHWELIARPLNRLSQLDLRGVPDSCGVWAPCLSYSNDTFFLVYTNVKTVKGIWRDMHNYLVTTEDIRGDWSEPVYLNSIGHDPSLFHDDDGRKWVLNTEWAYIKGKNVFNGIVIQEYDHKQKTLIGERRNIFKGTERGFTEGAHLYKRNGYYYLLTAEGGTWYNHCITMARSREIFGPYEIHPENPLLTSKDHPETPLQKAGHGDLVETQNGEWYLVHLCGRPITKDRRCVMGRETAIQKVMWVDNGWLYLNNFAEGPSVKVEAPQLPEFAIPATPTRIEFDRDELDLSFQTLRIPLPEDLMSLQERKGFLRLKGRESLASLNLQSLVARRQQSFCYTAETALEFSPDSSRHLAGLVVYYNTDNYYYLSFSCNDLIGKNLRIITCNKGETNEPTGLGVPLRDTSRVALRIVVNQEKGQFYYSTDEIHWQQIGAELDMSKLSDDFIAGKAFTGTFIGLCCQDLSGDGKYADFDYFEYQELDSIETCRYEQA